MNCLEAQNGKESHNNFVYLKHQINSSFRLLAQPQLWASLPQAWASLQWLQALPLP